MLTIPTPELVFERPTVRNGRQWTWTLCQPNAYWAELASGAASDRVTAVAEARAAFNAELAKRGEPPFAFDPVEA